MQGLSVHADFIMMSGAEKRSDWGAWRIASQDRRTCVGRDRDPRRVGSATCRRIAAADFQLSTKPRLGQIKAAGAENRDGTEATLGQEPIILPFGPFPSTWTAQHV